MADPVVLEDAKEPREIAQKYIESDHTHLRNEPLLWLFTSQAQTSKGRHLFVKVQRMSAVERYLWAKLHEEKADAAPQIKFIVSRGLWGSIDPPLKDALIDDALAHVGYDDEKDRLVLQDADLHVFADVVRRHGFFEEAVRTVVEAAREGQLNLFGEEGLERPAPKPRQEPTNFTLHRSVSDFAGEPGYAPLPGEEVRSPEEDDDEDEGLDNSSALRAVASGRSPVSP